MRYADRAAESVGLVAMGAFIAGTAWAQRGKMPAKQLIAGLGIGLGLVAMGIFA